MSSCMGGGLGVRDLRPDVMLRLCGWLRIHARHIGYKGVDSLNCARSTLRSKSFITYVSEKEDCCCLCSSHGLYHYFYILLIISFIHDFAVDENQLDTHDGIDPFHRKPQPPLFSFSWIFYYVDTTSLLVLLLSHCGEKYFT